MELMLFNILCRRIYVLSVYSWSFVPFMYLECISSAMEWKLSPVLTNHHPPPSHIACVNKFIYFAFWFDIKLLWKCKCEIFSNQPPTKNIGLIGMRNHNIYFYHCIVWGFIKTTFSGREFRRVEHKIRLAQFQTSILLRHKRKFFLARVCTILTVQMCVAEYFWFCIRNFIELTF